MPFRGTSVFSDEDLSDIERSIDLLRGAVAVLINIRTENGVTTRNLVLEARGTLSQLLDRAERRRVLDLEAARNQQVEVGR